MGEFLANIYDPLVAPLDPLGLRKWRKWAVGGVTGSILELGIGTGLNIEHYAETADVSAIDPDAASLSRARSRLDTKRRHVELFQARAEELPFPDHVFDAVVGTLVFCTISDPQRAMDQVHRVLKSGGRVRLVEHVRVRQPLIGRLQDLAAPIWETVSGGCHLNRDILGIVRGSSLQISAVHRRLGGLLIGIEAIKY